MQHNQYNWDPDEVVANLKLETESFDITHEELAKRKLRDNAAFAADAIIWLAMYSDNESMRFNASKYIVERVLGKNSDMGLEDQGEDVFERLLADCVSHVAAEDS